MDHACVDVAAGWRQAPCSGQGAKLHGGPAAPCSCPTPPSEGRQPVFWLWTKPQSA